MAHSTILVPLDGSAVAEVGLSSACRLARETSATLWLLRAVSFNAPDMDVREAERSHVHEAKRYLRRLRDELTLQGFTVHTEVLPSEAARAILFAYEAHDIDLISICTHGYTGLRRALLGSVAQAVLRRCPAPILLSHAGQAGSVAAMPYRRVLVPLDGTDFAESALAFLSKEHLGRDGEVILCRTVEPVLPPAMPLVSGEITARILREGEEETAKRRAEADTYLATTGNIYLRGWYWKPRSIVGYPAQELPALAKAEHADIIVMATHARQGFERLVHGSVAGEVVRHAEVPVLIVHGTNGVAREHNIIPISDVVAKPGPDGSHVAAAQANTAKEE